MSLTLKVAAIKGQTPSTPISCSFGREGGTIGRSEKNNFVLPDPERFISRNHGVISFEKGRYCYEDISLSGTDIGNRKLHLHNNKVVLEDGDRIDIGDYELLVSIYSPDLTEIIPAFSNGDTADAKNAVIAPGNAADENSGIGIKKEDSDDKFGDFEAAVKLINAKISQAALNQSSDPHRDHLFPAEISDIFKGPENEAHEAGVVIQPVYREDQMVLDEDKFASDSESGSESAEPSPNEADLAADSIPPEESISAQAQLGQAGHEESHLTPFEPAAALAETDEKDSSAVDFGGKPAGGVCEKNAYEKVIDSLKILLTELPKILPAEEKEFVEKSLNRIIENQADGAGGQLADLPDQSHSTNDRQAPREELFKIFLAAAGLENDSFCEQAAIADVMENAGWVLRQLVEGLLGLVEGRAKTRSQLRVAGTILGPIRNNPIKFSTGYSDTIKRLLGAGAEGYLSGVEAVRQCHADLMSHQVAMTVGIQAALKQALKRFDPGLYEQKYQSGLSFFRKAKCWDAYCADYSRNAMKVLDNFLDEEFIRAYEEQIEKFISARKK